MKGKIFSIKIVYRKSRIYYERKTYQFGLLQSGGRLKCPVASVKTVREVESKGEAFYPDGFPIILFERHKFYKHADRSQRGQWFNDHPSICNPNPTPRGGYGTKADQRTKFNLAFSLDPDAAMLACSWGLFQELGENYDDYGFASVNEFVDLMKSGEAGQLEIFVRSIIKRGLADELRRHQLADWHTFARNYNGPNYAAFDYHNKLDRAFAKWSKEMIDCDALVNVRNDEIVLDIPQVSRPLPVIQPVQNAPVQAITSDPETDPPTHQAETTETTTVEKTDDQTAQITQTKNEQDVTEPASVAAPEPQGVFSKLTGGITALFSGTFIYTIFEKFGGISISQTVLILIVVAIVLAFLGFLFWAALDAWKSAQRVRIEAEAKTNINKKDIVWTK